MIIVRCADDVVDWAIRFNEQGPDDLINIPSPGVPPKPGRKHRADRSGSRRVALRLRQHADLRFYTTQATEEKLAA